MHSFDIFCMSMTARAEKYVKNRGVALSDIEDLVQDAWLSFLESGYQAKTPDEWGLLFVACLEGTIADYFRKGRKESSGDDWEQLDVQQLEEKMEIIPDTGHDPLGETVVLQAYRNLDREIQTFPAREREAIILRLFNDVAIKEAAEMIGISEAALESAYLRGMVKVARILEKTV